MASVVVTVIVVALLLAGVSITAQGSLKSMDGLSTSWEQMEVRTNEVARTGIQFSQVTLAGAEVNVNILNSGQVALRDFENWIVIVEYYENNGTYHQLALPYAVFPPGDNHWALKGIYLDSSASRSEVHQPGMFDPGETITIRARINPPAKNDGKNLIVIGTPNGISVSSAF